MRMIGRGVSMVTELLNRVDAQIVECYRELSYLYSSQGASDSGLDALYARFEALPPNGDILNSDVINDTCIAFFDDDYAYTVNTTDKCIDIANRVVGHKGLHTKCEKCSIAFYQGDGKFGNNQFRLPHMSFFENGNYQHEWFCDMYELMVLLCQNFLEENQFKVSFIERVKSLKPS